MSPACFEDLFPGQRAARLQREDSGDSLTPPLVRGAHDHDLVDLRKGFDHLLDLGRIDIESAGDDEVALPVDDIQVSVLLSIADVSGAEPSVSRHHLCCCGW